MEGTETAQEGGDDLRALLNDAFSEGDDSPEVASNDKKQRARDEQGRFSKQEEQPAAEEKEDSAPEEKAQDEQPAEQPATGQKERIAPPAHWGGAAKVRWDKLPAAVQEAISKDYAELAGKEKGYGALEGVLAPHRQSLSMRYGDEVQGIKTLLAYAQALEQDPMGTLQYIARERGIDLSQFGAQQHGEAHGDGQQPNLQQIVQQVVQQQIAPLQQQLQQSQASPVKAQIDAFSQDPRYPYFNDVRVQMGALVHAYGQRGQNLTLEQAYEMAVNADPTIRAALQAEQQEKQAEEKAKKLAEAKAAQTIKGAPGHGGAVNGASAATLRGSIEEAWAAHT